MKNFILTGAAVLFFGLSSFAQKINQTQVPSVIVNTFQKAYPTANDIEWKKKGQNYKVEFEVGNLKEDHEILYSAQGTQLRHKEELPKGQCPAAIQKSLTQSHPGYVLKDVDKITTGNKVIYKVEIKTTSGKQKLYFNEAGQTVPRPQNTGK